MTELEIENTQKELKLFNSVYSFAKYDLGLINLEALKLAQFILDNQDKLKSYKG